MNLVKVFGIYLIISSLLFLAIIGLDTAGNLTSSPVGALLSIPFIPIIIIQYPFAAIGDILQVGIYPTMNYVAPLITMLLGGIILYKERDAIT